MKKRRKIEKSSPEFIKIGRQQLGLTQKQLAEELGVTTTTVNRWERGEVMPPKQTELAIQALLLQEKRELSSACKVSRRDIRELHAAVSDLDKKNRLTIERCFWNVVLLVDPEVLRAHEEMAFEQR